MSLTRLYLPFTSEKIAKAMLTKFRRAYGVALRGAVVIEHTYRGETEFDIHVPLGGTGFSAAEMKSAILALSREPNPLSRVAVNDPPQRPKGTRKKPSKRLTTRRAKTAKLPKGYYANPLTRVKVGSPSQRPSLVVVSEHGDPSPRLVKRRTKTKRGPAGAFANPVVQPRAGATVWLKVRGKWKTLATFAASPSARQDAEDYARALFASGESKPIKVTTPNAALEEARRALRK